MKTPFHGALTLLVYLLTIICTYALAQQGLKLRIPRTRWRVYISFCWIPWLATGLLLLFQAITFEEVGAALAGAGSLRPSSVIVTYLSLAYLAISCEITGLYSWMGLHAARWTRGRPVLLLAVFFSLSGALTAATGPDVSLIALTPLVAYTAGASNLDPMAMAATHLGASSVWGMLVPVAGTVNIITSHAFELTFTRFLGWMALPTCVAAMVEFGLMYMGLHWRRTASLQYDAWVGAQPYPDPGVMLHDQVGAACCSALLVGCLLSQLVAPWLRWSGWMVAALFAAVAALYNLAAASESGGLLRAAIGRRSAYERRRRLQAELMRLGLHRLVSDEDLADLVLSGSPDFRQTASLTRGTSAAGVGAAPHGTRGPVDASSGSGGGIRDASGGGGVSSVRQPAPSSSGGWSIGSHASSSFTTTTTTIATRGALGFNSGPGSGPGLGLGLSSGGSSGLHSLESLGMAIPDARRSSSSSSSSSHAWHWFSRQCSLFSFRSHSALPPAARSDLVVAAAGNPRGAGPDLRVLGHCGATIGGGGGGGGTAFAAKAAPDRPDAVSRVQPTHRVARAATAGGSASLANVGGGGSSVAPFTLAQMSNELQQLLTHGSAAAPESLEWWAAAALGAQEVLRTLVGAGLVAEEDTVAAPPPLTPLQPSGMCDDGDPLSAAADGDSRGSEGGVMACSNGLGFGPLVDSKSGPASCGIGADVGGGGSGGSLSPFADPIAVSSFLGWDGTQAGGRSSTCWAVAASTSNCRDGCGGSGSACVGVREPRAVVSSREVFLAWAHDPQDITRGATDSGGVGEQESGPRIRGYGGELRIGGILRAASSEGGRGGGAAAVATAASTTPSFPWPPSGATAAAAAATSVGGHCPQKAAAAAAALPPTGGDGSDGGDATSPANCRDPSLGDSEQQQQPAILLRSRFAILRQEKSGGGGGGAGRHSLADGSCSSSSGGSSSVGMDAAQPTVATPPCTSLLPSLSYMQPTMRFIQLLPSTPPAQLHQRQQSLSLLPLARRGAGGGGDDKRDSDGGHLAADANAAEAFLAPPVELINAAGAEADLLLPTAAAAAPPPPTQRRPARSSASGFQGLFGCWRRGTDPDGTALESAALLPACAASSHDPCHVLQVSQTPRPASAVAKSCTGNTSAAESVSMPGDALPSPYVSVHAYYGDGLLSSPLSLGDCPAAAAGATAGVENSHNSTALLLPRRPPPPPPVPSRSRACPVFSPSTSTSTFTVYSNARERGYDDRGGGGGLSRCESGFAAIGGNAATGDGSWVPYKLRRPSVALLLVGSSEVSFLSTFLSLPWANTILLLGWFVLVEALQVHGWLDALAGFLSTIANANANANDPVRLSTATGDTGSEYGSETAGVVADVSSGDGGSSSAASVAAAVFVIGWLAVLFSIGMTGQAAALLLARVLMRPEFRQTLPYQEQQQPAESSPAEAAAAAFAGSSLGSAGNGGFGAATAAHRGAQLALVIAASMAPALSLSGSLTALRWGLGLRALGVRMQCCKTLVSGLAPAAVAGTTAALLVLWVECIVWQ